MFKLFTTPLPVIIALATGFGVLIHDTQIDKATATAIAVPAVLATYGAADIALKLSDPHTHAERVSVAASNPRVQPRSGDDKKYISLKKFGANSLSGDYSWPSV